MGQNQPTETEADRRIREIGPTHALVELRDLSPDEQVINPTALRELVQGPNAAANDPRGIQIAGGRIEETLDLSYTDISVPLIFGRTTFSERPDFSYCKVPSLDLLECELPGLDADFIDVAHSLTLHGTRVSGELRLQGAKIGANLDCVKAKVVAPDTGVNAQGIDIGGNAFLTDGFHCEGSLNVLGCHISGVLNCSRATITNPSAKAIDADLSRIDGALSLEAAVITGEVSAIRAAIGSDLICSGAEITANTDELQDALSLDGATIAGNASFDQGFQASGCLRIVSTKIIGSAMLHNANLIGKPESTSLAATGAEIGLWFSLKGTTFSGRVALIGVKAAGLIDDLGTGEARLGSWASANPLMLTNFRYDTITGGATLNADERANWLEHTETYDPLAWEHLRALYRAQGREDDARRIAIAGQEDRRKRAKLSRLRKLGRWVLGISIRHGYRPALAGLWASLVIAAFAGFVAASNAAKHPQFVPEKTTVTGKPQPVAYAVDVFLPIVDLGQSENYAPQRAARWVEWGVIIAGWALTTLFVAGFTSLVRT